MEYLGPYRLILSYYLCDDSRGTVLEHHRWRHPIYILKLVEREKQNPGSCWKSNPGPQVTATSTLPLSYDQLMVPTAPHMHMYTHTHTYTHSKAHSHIYKVVFSFAVNNKIISKDVCAQKLLSQYLIWVIIRPIWHTSMQGSMYVVGLIHWVSMDEGGFCSL